MGSRNAQKEMLKSFGNFETCLKTAEHVLTSSKTKIKKLLKLCDELKEHFYTFDAAFRVYKSDTIAKDCTDDTIEFNGRKEDGTYCFTYNDDWIKEQMTRYLTTTELMEEKIEELEQSQAGETEAKLTIATSEETYVAEELNSEKEALSKSVSDLSSEVENMKESNWATTVGIEKLTDKLRSRLDAFRIKSRTVETTLRSNINQFCNDESCKLDTIQLKLSRILVMPDSAPVVSTVGAAKSESVRQSEDRVYLEKSKPPKFKGDITEFPEFKKKWQNIVGKANLPEVAEIERLKENIPVEARDLLYGVEDKTKAWEILDKRYGYVNLIAKKLKTQLKSIQQEGKTDPERVISLCVKVHTIVTKLETLKMSDALRYDSEFLSAVYCALPNKHQVRWLDFEKTDNHWSDMLRFLERAYNQANDELALLGTYEADTKKLANKPSSGKAFGSKVSNRSEEEDTGKERARKRSQEYCGKCPLCSKEHTWTRKSGDQWPSDRYLSCRKFNDLSVVARAQQVQKSKGCARCLSWNHARDSCRMPMNNCNNDLAGGVKCKGDHSKLVCGSGIAYCAAASVHSDEFGDLENVGETVFFLQDIPLVNCEKDARVFWDDGSNRVFIRNKYAEDMKLRRKKVEYSLEAVGQSPETRSSYIYLLELIDIHGSTHKIWGYGIEKIMTCCVPDMSSLKLKFPHVPSSAFEPLAEQEVDILIGLNMADIMPSGGLGKNKVGGVKALKSLFGTGWVVGGQLDVLESSYSVPIISSQALKARCAKITVVPERGISTDFWDMDQPGVKLPARCDRCRHCLQSGECSESHAGRTLKEQAELALIKSKTKLENGQIWCDFPFIKDPVCLPNNRDAAVAVAEKVRKSLIRDNLLDAYNKQVQEILDRKAAVRLSDQEMLEYQGPCQYISHHPVLKNSVSTPVRMVTNSSFPNGGSSLNQCLAAGPNSLNSMLAVLLRFRSWEVVFHYDLSKAYNSMKTGLTERHLRRFVWKFADESDWTDYAFDVVHFGDRSAACQLEVAKDLIADTYEYIDPEAAQRIRDDTYVDDGVSGGNEQQVRRFIGMKNSDGTFSGTVSQILDKGGFKLKAIVKSGEQDVEQIEKLGTSIFGYVWNAEKDEIGVKFPVNLSKKRRSVRVQPNITLSEVDKLGEIRLTKRILLGFVNSFGDPLGIASPWYMKRKVLMKKLYQLDEPLSWDESILLGNRQEWLDVMIEVLTTGVLMFPRSTRPFNATGEGPMLIGTGDGALPGFGGNVYLRWPTVCTHLEVCEGKGDYFRSLQYIFLFITLQTILYLMEKLL